MSSWLRPRLRHALIAIAIAVAGAACGGVHGGGPRPVLPADRGDEGATSKVDTGARATAAAPAEEEWRSYVPERCRDEDGEEREGCRRRRVVVTSAVVEILEPISFVGNTAELEPGAHRTVGAIADSLLGNPSILVLEVRGHSDSLLHPADRADLARQRAEVVAKAIIAQGVDAARITTYGASDSELIYPADDPRNRRVEFVILSRDE